MDYGALLSIGFTDGEIRVYASLLELGPTSTGKLIRQTSLQKSTVYDCLERLMKKGLASYITKNGKKVFHAAPPEKINEFAEQKENEFLAQKHTISLIAGQLSKTMKTAKAQEKGAWMFEGWHGMKTAFDNILETAGNKEGLVFSVSIHPSIFARFSRFINKFHQKRCKKRIKIRILINEQYRNSLGKSREREKYTKVRYVPEEFSTPAVINIYGDRVLIAIWGENPVALAIDDESASSSFRNYFELLWSRADK